jgi:protein SCO1/2
MKVLRNISIGTVAFLLTGLAIPVTAHESEAGHQQMMSATAMDQHDPHAMHHHMMHDMQTRKELKRSTNSYEVPPVMVTRADDQTLNLEQELDDGRPVVLNFIYTSCTEICPLTSNTFSMFQSLLGSDASKVHLVSISIDPEQDTPAVLRKYSEKYKAGSAWDFYTGTVAASITAQKSFDAYLGEKMNHVPVTYVRAAPGDAWLRIDGFVSAEELMHDYRRLIAAR